jgi:hypothetical protein
MKAIQASQNLTTDLHWARLDVQRATRELAAASQREIAWGKKVTHLCSEVASAEAIINRQHNELTSLGRQKVESTRLVRQLTAKLSRSSGVLDRAVARARRMEGDKHIRQGMKKRGAFTTRIRALVSFLISRGVSASSIGDIIREAGAAFGVNINYTVSRRTAHRIGIENYVKSVVQLGYEALDARGQ